MKKNPVSKIERLEPIRDSRLELADALREIANACSTTDLTAEDLTAAIELTRHLRERLEGKRRRRWYEQPVGKTARGPTQQIDYFETSPIRGVINPIAPPLELESEILDDGSTVIIGRARLGLAYEGPPHGVHGGWIAALFDEVLGATQGLDGSVRVTAILKVKYREITPIDEELRFVGRLAEKRGGRQVVKATCHARNRLTADAEGIFVTVDLNEIQQRMGQ